MPVDLSRMLHEIEDRLSPYTVGYSIAIYEDTTLRYSTGDGEAIVTFDERMSSFTRMDCLSMSKTITAAAVVHVLLSKGLSVSARIGPFLPGHWNPGDNVEDVTFRDLLTHTSGMASGGWSYAELETFVEQDASALLNPPVDYENANYALFRVLVANVDRGAAFFDNLWDAGLSGVVDEMVAGYFIGYVQKNVFSPCGVSVSAGYEPLPFDVPTPGQAVWYKFGDTDKSCRHGSEADAWLEVGPDYWNLSVRNYAKFAARLRAGMVFGPELWQTMRDTRAPGAGALPAYPAGDARLGLWRFDGAHGNYYGHNGGWTCSNDAGAFTGWMAFPNGITAAFFANSDIAVAGLEEQEKMLLDSHDAAWT